LWGGCNATYYCTTEHHLKHEKAARTAKHETNGMFGVRDSFENKGISSEVIIIFINSWRTGKRSRYGTYGIEWFGFCRRQCINQSIAQVLQFLHVIHKCKVGYSVINTARSKLSSFIEVEGYYFYRSILYIRSGIYRSGIYRSWSGQHPLVCRYLKGIHNISPSLPKDSFTWNVGIVINYLKTKQQYTYEPH